MSTELKWCLILLRNKVNKTDFVELWEKDNYRMMPNTSSPGRKFALFGLCVLGFLTISYFSKLRHDLEKNVFKNSKYSFLVTPCKSFKGYWQLVLCMADGGGSEVLNFWKCDKIRKNTRNISINESVITHFYLFWVKFCNFTILTSNFAG